MPELTGDAAIDAREEAQRIEYGTWRATQPISVNGVLAFQPGHPVPVSHVEKYGYDAQGLVERVDDPPAQPDPEVPATAPEG